MRRSRYISIFLPLILGVALSAQDGQTAKATQKATTTAEAIDCSGTAQQCVKPAKFLTSTPQCVCFTCGYNTPGSKTVCTKSVQQARSLARITQESGFADSDVTAAVAALAQHDKSQQFDTQEKEHRDAH